MTIASLIIELKQAYAEAGLDCGEGLLPPASKTALDRMLTELSLPLPSELRQVYAVHSGQGYVSPGITGLFGRHRLLTPDEVIDHHLIYCDTCPAWKWDAKLIPFASFNADDLCVHSESGAVGEFSPSGGLWCHRPSITAVLLEILEAVRAGEGPFLREYRQTGG
jgi:hypothetical protein